MTFLPTLTVEESESNLSANDKELLGSCIIAAKSHDVIGTSFPVEFSAAYAKTPRGLCAPGFNVAFVLGGRYESFDSLDEELAIVFAEGLVVAAETAKNLAGEFCLSGADIDELNVPN